MSRTQRLCTVLLLNLALVAALMIAGAAAHSVAVLAAGGDCMLDAAGVGVALLAIRLSARRARAGRSAARPAPTSIAALVNCGWLLLLELLISAAAADRLVTGPPAVRGLPVLVVSGAAAVVMAACALVLRTDPGDDESDAGERDPSVAAVLLDTIADAAAAAGVAAAGAIILLTGGWYWLDPALALFVAIVVAIHAVALMRNVVGRIRSEASSSG